MTHHEEPLIKRRKQFLKGLFKMQMSQQHKKARFTLSNYYAGHHWKSLEIDDDDDAPRVAIGNKLYRSPNRMQWTGPNLIQVSDDYGISWRTHLELESSIIQFEVLPAQSADTPVVYCIAVKRVGEDHFSELWVTRDSMRTFQIVNSRTEFGTRWNATFLAIDERALLISGGRSHLDGSEEWVQDTWISADGGYSWTEIVPHCPGTRAIEFVRNAMICHKTKLYAVLHAILISKLILAFSTDGGETWQKIPCPLEPRALIKQSDRILCFSDGEYVQLPEDPELADISSLERHKTTTVIRSGQRLKSLTIHCFSSGDMLLDAFTHSHGLASAISHPDRALYASHRLLLKLVLGRCGIDTALFDVNISPFLFP